MGSLLQATGMVALLLLPILVSQSYTVGAVAINPDICSLLPCRNNGSCQLVGNQTMNGAAYTCTCKPGWTGSNCTEILFPCDSQPCRNGASCLPAQGDDPSRLMYTCSCTPGWTGDLCDRPTCRIDSQYGVPNYANFEQFGDGDPGSMAFSRNYCLFGGKCRIGSPTSLPTCDCPPGQRGIRCSYTYTIVTKVTPVVGPQSGGTDISFQGYNLNRTRFPLIQLGLSDCLVKFVNKTLLICTSPRVADINPLLPKTVKIYFNRDTLNGTLDETFTYVEDPTILSIAPLYTILSGGVKLNVTGTGLDTVGKPYLQITVVFEEAAVHVFESLCAVNSATKMQCYTPKLEIVNSDGELDLSVIPPTTTEYPPYYGAPIRRRRRRALLEPMKIRTAQLREAELRSKSLFLEQIGNLLQRHRRQVDGTNTKIAEYKINNRTVEFYFGFRLDGVPTYRNLTETLPKYSKVTVYTDPYIKEWTEDHEVRSGSNQLEVEGERLTVGIQARDYRMMIGQTQCSDLEVYNNKIICTAPTTTPEPHPQDTIPQTYTVTVHIGVLKEPFHVGMVKYRTAFWDNPLNKYGIIGACIVVGFIGIIIVAAVVACRTTRA